MLIIDNVNYEIKGGGSNLDSDVSRTTGKQIDKEQLKKEIITASFEMKKVAKSLLCGGVTRKEFFVLEVLNMKKIGCENGMYVSELAEHIKISMPQASRMLKNMEEKGYIRREIDENNRRNTFVHTTEKGAEARIKAKQEMDSFVDSIITEMGEQNIRKLIELINLSANIMEKEALKRKENQDV